MRVPENAALFDSDVAQQEVSCSTNCILTIGGNDELQIL